VDYRVTVYLSKQPRRTLMLRDAEGIKQALNDGCHVEAYTLLVDASTHDEAANIAFGVCNSYSGELHCGPEYRDDVLLYRASGHRSLSVGDVVKVARLSKADEAWMGCAPIGWVELA
jgi:hypothetical protein